MWRKYLRRSLAHGYAWDATNRVFDLANRGCGFRSNVEIEIIFCQSRQIGNVAGLANMAENNRIDSFDDRFFIQREPTVGAAGVCFLRLTARPLKAFVFYVEATHEIR